MRRTDMSRKIGRAVTSIEEAVIAGGTFDLGAISNIVKNELDIKPSKTITVADAEVINFKDMDFECTIKKSDVQKASPSSKEHGIKEMKNNYGMAQVKYMNDVVEISLVVEVEYIDNQGKKHKSYPTLKSENIELSNNNSDDAVAVTKVEKIEPVAVVEESVVENKVDIQEVAVAVEESVVENNGVVLEPTYKDIIKDTVVAMFKKRFYGTIPSDELINLIIDKKHNIYMIGYLEQLFDTEATDELKREGKQVLQRILNLI